MRRTKGKGGKSATKAGEQGDGRTERGTGEVVGGGGLASPLGDEREEEGEHLREINK
jgi:hypothetical protein